MRFIRLLVILAFALCPLAAGAQLTLTFDESEKTIFPSQTITFSGTVQNLSQTETVEIVSDSYNLFSSFLTLDDSKFLLNAPDSLAPGASWSGEMFDIGVTGTFETGVFDGDFTVLTNNALFDVTTPFRVRAVPTPGALMTALLGLTPGLLLLHRRSLRRA
jgi:hypothetical protein